MKKMKMFAVISAMVIVVSSLTACGSVDIESMTVDEIVDFAEGYGIDVTVEEDIIESDEAVEDEVEVEDEAEAVEGEVVEDEAEAESTEAPETEAPKTEVPKTETPKVEVEQPAKPTPAPAQPTPEPTPTHTHSWKEHTATKQVWVPNIVVVDDYEIQNVEVGRLYSCNCGFQTTDYPTMESHGINHVFAKEESNYGVSTIYEQQQVKVGSHEEDHGHYENTTYVDYYYCDCGSTKN